MNNGSTSNRAAAREEVMATMFVEGRVFAAGGAFALTDTNQRFTALCRPPGDTLGVWVHIECTRSFTHKHRVDFIESAEDGLRN